MPVRRYWFLLNILSIHLVENAIRFAKSSTDDQQYTKCLWTTDQWHCYHCWYCIFPAIQVAQSVVPSNMAPDYQVPLNTPFFRPAPVLENMDIIVSCTLHRALQYLKILQSFINFPQYAHSTFNTLHHQYQAAVTNFQSICHSYGVKGGKCCIFSTWRLQQCISRFVKL